jgi:hypothetical protein
MSAYRADLASLLFHMQVANKRNGIDVDKFDYLKRDAMMCGVGVPLDAKRLMLFSRVSPDMQQVRVLVRLCLVRAVSTLQTHPSSTHMYGASDGCWSLCCLGSVGGAHVHACAIVGLCCLCLHGACMGLPYSGLTSGQLHLQQWV